MKLVPLRERWAARSGECSPSPTLCEQYLWSHHSPLFLQSAGFSHWQRRFSLLGFPDWTTEHAYKPNYACDSLRWGRGCVVSPLLHRLTDWSFSRLCAAAAFCSIVIRSSVKHCCCYLTNSLCETSAAYFCRVKLILLVCYFTLLYRNHQNSITALTVQVNINHTSVCLCQFNLFKNESIHPDFLLISSYAETLRCAVSIIQPLTCFIAPSVEVLVWRLNAKQHRLKWKYNR